MGELLARPLRLAGFGEFFGQFFLEVRQQGHVEYGVFEPAAPQGPPRPVRLAMTLAHRVPQLRLHERGQTHPLQSEQLPGDLGVEQIRGHETDLSQTIEVVVRGLHHPLLGPQHLGERAEVVDADRVEQQDGGVAAVHLHQVGPLRVPVAARPLGVHTQRSLAIAQGPRGLFEFRGRVHHVGQRGIPVQLVAHRINLGATAVRIVDCQAMYPFRIDVATISARSPQPILRAIRARCDFTVSDDRPRCSPTARLV